MAALRSFGLFSASLVVAAFVGCSVANAPDDPLDPGSTGGASVANTTGSGAGSQSSSTGMGGMGTLPIGEACAGAGECMSGYCADGVCCEAACDGRCVGCNVAGSEGMCLPHDAGSDPDGDCAGGACNGVGDCIGGAGTPCQTAAECNSTYCVDGVCCDAPCAGICEACSMAKTGTQDGTCRPVTLATDPDNECTGGLTCGGAGQCACPTFTGQLSVAGPLSLYNFCWYLANQGITCDQACSELGGTNLAAQAQNAWTNGCMMPSGVDVTTAFYNAGNPGGWTGPGTGTSCHTLGYGYPNLPYYGKCTTGTLTTCGSYPNDTNTSTTRMPVCACFND